MLGLHWNDRSLSDLRLWYVCLPPRGVKFRSKLFLIHGGQVWSCPGVHSRRVRQRLASTRTRLTFVKPVKGGCIKRFSFINKAISRVNGSINACTRYYRFKINRHHLINVNCVVQ